MKGEWSYREGLLSADECKTLIEIGKSNLPRSGTIGLKDQAVDTVIRNAEVSFISRSNCPETFDMIDTWVAQANMYWFGIDYWPNTMDVWQFSIYRKGHFYRPHQDCTLDSDSPHQRKISVTIQLSDGDDYEGGDFRFNYISEQPPPRMIRQLGTALAFPSLAIHEVLPVTKGTRYALVGWYPGPVWR